MKEPSHALQPATVAALKASAALKALIGDPVRVRDKVEDGLAFPYVRIGDDQVLDDSNGCADAWEVFSTFHIFADDAAARMTVKQICGAIVAAVCDPDAPIAPAGFAVTLSKMHDFRSFFEADGVTAHGVLVVRHLVDAAA
jgi:hypothetical protein